MYKFDSFPKSVLSSNWPKFPTLSLRKIVRHTPYPPVRPRVNNNEVCLTIFHRDKVGNFGQFDDKTLFGNEANLYTKIEIYSQYFSLTSQC